MQSFTNKTALITGATSGIGRSIAFVLAKEHCNLVLVSRNKKKMMDLQSILQSNFSISVYILALDLSDRYSAQKVFEFCRSNNLQVDVLVNNAGFAIGTNREFDDLEQLGKMMTLHMTTLTSLCALFVNEMKEKQHGYILNISSITAIIPAASTLTYSATKRYIYYYSKLLREEVKCNNIIVSCSLPGATKTSFDTHSNLPVPESLKKWYVSSDFVAKKSIQGLIADKGTIIPGWQTKLLYIVGLFLPESLAYRIHKKIWVQKRSMYLHHNKR